MDASSRITIDETSVRYDGWRIVAVCFLVATFGWGLGFYGQSVYVAELHRLHGWPASLISSGTTFFYLFGALLVVFVSEAIRSFGPRNCLLAGVCAMAAAAVLIGRATDALAALCRRCGAGVRLGRHQPRRHHQHARALVRQEARHGDQPGAERRKLRRHRRRTAAGGGDRRFGFSGAMMAAAIVMLALMVPVILVFVGRPPARHVEPESAQPEGAVGAADPRPGVARRRIPDVSIAFALVLFAQVGFIVHLIAFLDPVIGREQRRSRSRC